MNAIKLTWQDFEFGLDIDPELGTADTGDIQIDLPNLFIALGEAALERETALYTPQNKCFNLSRK